MQDRERAPLVKLLRPLAPKMTGLKVPFAKSVTVILRRWVDRAQHVSR